VLNRSQCPVCIGTGLTACLECSGWQVANCVRCSGSQAVVCDSCGGSRRAAAMAISLQPNFVGRHRQRFVLAGTLIAAMTAVAVLGSHFRF
jgi:hypothetical protein